MQVSTANDVKVYNLSAGKSLPEWISDRKKRTLLKNDIGETCILKIYEGIITMGTLDLSSSATQD